jgi:hypothetical protein
MAKTARISSPMACPIEHPADRQVSGRLAEGRLAIRWSRRTAYQVMNIRTTELNSRPTNGLIIFAVPCSQLRRVRERA